MRRFTTMSQYKKVKPNKQKNINKKSQWTWTDTMIASLINCLIEYKAEKSFESLDFEADLVSLYSDLRRRMSIIYSDFGLVDVDTLDTDVISNCVQKKISIYKKKV